MTTRIINTEGDLTIQTNDSGTRIFLYPNDHVQLTQLNISGNTTICGTLSVLDNLNISGNLTVGGSSTISQTLLARNTATVESNLSVGGNVTLSGTLSVGGATYIAGTLSVVGDTTLAGSLSVGGTTTVSGDVVVTGNATVSGTMFVRGTVTVCSTLSIGYNTVIGTDLSVGNNLIVNNTLSTYGGVYLGQNSNVANTSNYLKTISGNLYWNNQELDYTNVVSGNIVGNIQTELANFEPPNNTAGLLTLYAYSNYSAFKSESYLDNISGIINIRNEIQNSIYNPQNHDFTLSVSGSQVRFLTTGHTSGNVNWKVNYVYDSVDYYSQ